MKYWDSGFPIPTEDGETTISMKYWDSGFPFGYAGIASAPAYQLGTIDGTARASLETVDGLALANFGGYNGLV